MALWTAPTDGSEHGSLVAGAPLTSRAYATYVRDNLTYLHDLIAAGSSAAYGTPVALTVGATGSIGANATQVARSDHVHGAPATWPLMVRQAGTTVATRATLDFVGTGVTVTQSPSTPGQTDVSISTVTMTYASPTRSQVGDTVSAGSGAAIARSDHRHERESWGTPGYLTPGSVASPGTANPVTLARSDHAHGVPANWPVRVRVNGALVGARATLNLIAGNDILVSQRSILGAGGSLVGSVNVYTVDHVPTGTTVTVSSDASATLRGTRPALNLIAGAGVTIAGSATDSSTNTAVITVTPVFTFLPSTASSAPVTGYAAWNASGGDVGTSGSMVARGDHTHAIDTTQSQISGGTPSVIAASASVATSASGLATLARADHVHGAPRIYGAKVQAIPWANFPLLSGDVLTNLTDLPVRPTINVVSGDPAGMAITASDTAASSRTDIDIASMGGTGTDGTVFLKGYDVSGTSPVSASWYQSFAPIVFRAIPQTYKHLLLEWTASHAYAPVSATYRGLQLSMRLGTGLTAYGSGSGGSYWSSHTIRATTDKRVSGSAGTLTDTVYGRDLTELDVGRVAATTLIGSTPTPYLDTGALAPSTGRIWIHDYADTLTPKVVEAENRMEFDPDVPNVLFFFQYSKPVTITNGGSAVDNYVATITVAYVATKMNADFSDVRFTLAGSTALLDCWRKSYTASSTAEFWVRFPSLPAGATVIAVRYGNSTALTSSSFTNTFPALADDFEAGDAAFRAAWTCTGQTGVTGLSTDAETSASVQWMARNQFLYSGNPAQTAMQGTYSIQLIGHWDGAATPNQSETAYDAKVTKTFTLPAGSYRLEFLERGRIGGTSAASSTPNTVGDKLRVSLINVTDTVYSYAPVTFMNRIYGQGNYSLMASEYNQTPYVSAMVAYTQDFTLTATKTLRFEAVAHMASYAGSANLWLDQIFVRPYPVTVPTVSAAGTEVSGSAAQTLPSTPDRQMLTQTYGRFPSTATQSTVDAWGPMTVFPSLAVQQISLGLTNPESLGDGILDGGWRGFTRLRVHLYGIP